MHANATLITHFYDAFARRDGAAMAACYTDDATFSDPVFRGLRGREVGGMWQMLCEGAQDLEVRASKISADDTTGAAHWDADYTFSASGRAVRNRIDAVFTFRDGRIATHVDTFALWRWTRMALGPAGVLLGWSPPLQGKLRKTARKGLDKWLAKNP